MKKFHLYKSFPIKQNILNEILCKELSISKEKLFLLDEIDDKYIKNIKKSIKKYQKGLPIEYILKQANFYSLDFFVDKRVLIPRNDTEVMVKEALKEAKKYKNITLIDVGTGSGNIAISCLVNSPNFKNCFIIDKSQKALEVAKVNIKNYNLQNKIVVLKGNLLNKISWLFKDKNYQNSSIYKSRNLISFLNDTFILPDFPLLTGEIIITANLPYIKNNDFKNMSPETLKYEPKMALFGGNFTGFELYEKLINEIIKLNIYKSRNTNKGNLTIILFIEVGFDQYKYAKKYLKNLGLEAKFFKDNSGIWRCAKITFKF